MTTAPAVAFERASKTGQRVAAVVHRPREMFVREATIAEPGPDQVRIRLEGCGLCGSNVPVWEGRPWFNYPLEPGAPGHEGWGIVEEVGWNVKGLQPGDRVAALSYHAFASHDIADASHVVQLPAALDGAAFPGEAIGCAINVFRRCHLRQEQTLAIVGVGFLGALLIQLAAARGVRTLALSRRRFSLEIAQRCGANKAVPSTSANTVSIVQDWTSGAGCDCVIEATGLQGPLDLASQLVKTRGRLVIAGYHQDGPRRVDMQSWNWRGIDVINAHERDPQLYLQAMREAAADAAAGRLRIKELLTHEFPLTQINNAFRLASERPDGFLKAWIRCN